MATDPTKGPTRRPAGRPAETKPAGGLDWASALARLDRLAREPTHEDTAARLERRTRELAAPKAADAGAARVETVGFERGGLRFAVRVEEAQAVVPLGHLLVLPGVGGPHLGVAVHDGQLYAVVDPAPLIAAEATYGPAAAAPAPRFVVLLRAAEFSIGLAADAVAGIVALDDDRLAAATGHHAFVAAILPGGAHLLSPEDIGRNVRLVVDHRLHDAALL